MTAPAPALYEAAVAERAAWNGAPPVAERRAHQPAADLVEPTAIGPWAAFLAAFDDLLAAARTGDGSGLSGAREDLAELRARLAVGGVAVPSVTRRVPALPTVDARYLPDRDAR